MPEHEEAVSEGTAALVVAPQRPVPMPPPPVPSVPLPTLFEAWQERPAQAVFPTSNPLLSTLLGGGLRAGQLYLCSATPGAGKTSLALAAIVQPCVYYGYPVLFVSAELDGDWLAARYAAMRLNVSWLDVLDGRVSDDDVRYVLDEGQVHFLGPESSAKYELAARQMHALYGSSFVIIVDYLQLLALPLVIGKNGDTQAVNRILLDFRKVSRQLRVPVWAISSTPRSMYNTEGKTEAYLGSFKQSGDLEYLALAVLHLRAKELRADGLRPIEVHIPKGRVSGVSNFVLFFNGATGVFYSSSESIRDVRTQDFAADVLEAIVSNRARYTSPEQIARDLQKGAKEVRDALAALERSGRIQRIRVQVGGRDGYRPRLVWDVTATPPASRALPGANGNGQAR